MIGVRGRETGSSTAYIPTRGPWIHRTAQSGLWSKGKQPANFGIQTGLISVQWPSSSHSMTLCYANGQPGDGKVKRSKTRTTLDWSGAYETSASFSLIVDLWSTLQCWTSDDKIKSRSTAKRSAQPRFVASNTASTLSKLPFSVSCSQEPNAH
jgi:hypothetical protein